MPTPNRPPRPAEPLPARTVAVVAIVAALLTGGALVALVWWVNPEHEGIWGTVVDERLGG